jgi:putative glutamine amidotransferase
MTVPKRVLVPYRSEEKVMPYLRALERAGLEPVAHHVDTPATLANADALLLMGGTDVDPRLYGEEPHAETDQPDRVRDNNELALLTEALARDVPVLAICRGVQLLNVHQGGTLLQHLDSVRHDPELANKGAAAHEVAVQPATLLANAVGEVSIGVNSRHHQAIARPGHLLRVCAIDPGERVIESVDLPGKRWVLGVQWHPEDQVDSPAAVRLFEALAQAMKT